MNNLIFLDKIYFLLFIPLVISLIYLFLRNKNKLDFLYYEDLKKIYWKSSFFYILFFILITSICIIFVFILANPNKENTSKTILKNWIDIILIFDVSYSMDATDLNPSRIEVARWVISTFLWWLKTDRVWVIVFSWKPFVSIPLTFDYSFLKEYVSKITTSIIAQNSWNLQWTALWDAILMWSYLFDKKNIEREKVMIIVTDWEANKWLPPDLALKLLKEKNIKTYTIWVWWLEKTFVNVSDNFWNKIKVEIWWIDEITLKKIAVETWWKYFRANSNEVLKKYLMIYQN